MRKIYHYGLPTGIVVHNYFFKIIFETQLQAKKVFSPSFRWCGAVKNTQRIKKSEPQRLAFVKIDILHARKDFACGQC